MGSFKMEPENETDDFETHVFNSSLSNHEQEDKFLNIHLHSVSYEQWVIYGLAMPTFVGISLILNSLIFIVLLKDKFKSSLNLLLHCLSCYDITVGLMSFWVYSWPTICQYLGIFPDYLTNIHPTLVPFLLPVWHMTITGSDYLNLAAVVERLLATDGNFRKDKKTQQHLGFPISTAKCYILNIFLFTVLFNVPAFLELETSLNDEENLQVVETELRNHEVYKKMYRLMAEFLIFKATPWFAFLILWLLLNSRIRFYTKKKSIRRTLTIDQYEEMRDTRIVLGIIGLFYVCNILTFYNSVCHIMLFHVSDLVQLLATLSLVLNSTFKFCVYFALSNRFRDSVIGLCSKE